MNTKPAHNTVRSGSAATKVASKSRRLPKTRIEESKIIAELAKIAAQARIFGGKETYAVTFMATFDSKGRRIKNAQHMYDIECISGCCRGCSGEGNTVHDTIRELIAAMQLRLTHLTIADIQADILRKRNKLDQAARLLESAQRRLPGRNI